MTICFVADGLNKYFEVFGDKQSISLFVRSIFQLIFIFLGFLVVDKRSYDLYFGIFILLFCFLIGQTALLFGGQLTPNDFLLGFKVFNKFIYAFILFPVVDYILRKNPNLIERLVKVFYGLFIANILIVLFGLFLDSELIKSYPLRERFGYSGLIPKRNEATLFYVLGLSVGYFRLVVQKKKERPLFLIGLVGSLILGTKGMYIFLLFLGLFHIRFNKKLIKTLFIGLVVSFILIILILPNTEMYSYYYSQAERLGFFTMLLSGRDIIFFNELNSMTQGWSILNVFVGGQNQSNKIFEMDFLDLFFFLGVIGGLVYIFLYMKYFFASSKRIAYHYFFIFSYFFLAFFGGHFFSSAVNALYFVIVTLYIFNYKAIEKTYHK
ncbi:MAG: hypothetical protein AAF348_18715 [Bacteroidota bacterium]